MEEYQERVVTEASELRDKLIALRKFIDADSFCTIGMSQRDQTALYNQEDVMAQYLSILRTRIDNFKED